MKRLLPIVGLLAACNRSTTVPAPIEVAAINAARDSAVQVSVTAGSAFALPYAAAVRLPLRGGLVEASVQVGTSAQSFFLEISPARRMYLLVADTGRPALPVVALFDRQAPLIDSAVYLRLLNMDDDTAFSNLQLMARDTLPMGAVQNYLSWFQGRNGGNAAATGYGQVRADTLLLGIRRQGNASFVVPSRQVVLRRGRAYTILFSKRRQNGQRSFTVLED